MASPLGGRSSGRQVAGTLSNSASMSSTLQQPHAIPTHVSRLRRFRFDRPQQFAALLLFAAAHAMPLGHRARTPHRSGLPIRSLRPRDVGASLAHRRLLHHLRQYPRRRARLPPRRPAAYPRAHRRRSAQRHFHLGDATRAQLRQPASAPAVYPRGGAAGRSLWWVTRRLFGNPGGYVALGFFCVSPPVIRAATSPSPEILTALGFFAAIYTAIGVAHALQGPRRKWRPRILLLAAGFALVAASHSAAILIALPLAIILMLYLAERRRTTVPSHPGRRHRRRVPAGLRLLRLPPRRLQLLLPLRRRPPRPQPPPGPPSLQRLVERRSHPRCRRRRRALPLHPPLALLRQHRTPGHRAHPAAPGHHGRPGRTHSLGAPLPAHLHRRGLRRYPRRRPRRPLPLGAVLALAALQTLLSLAVILEPSLNAALSR